MLSARNEKIVAACLLALTLAIALQVFQHFAPGALSPDSLTILAQARSGVFEDGHPPLMAALWRLFDRIIPGPMGMLVFHLGLFYGGLYLIFLWAIPRYGFYVLPASLVVGLFPSIIGILGTIWIDITMAGFFLTALGIGLAGCNRPERCLRVAALIGASLSVGLGTAVRHNGASGAFPLISFFLLLYVFERSRYRMHLASAMFSGLLLACVLLVATRQIAARFVDVKRDLWRMGALFDIAGSSYQEKKSLFYSNIVTGDSLENIDKLYSPRSVTPLVVGRQIHALPGQPVVEGRAFEFNVSDPRLNQRLRANWREVILHHTGAYLRHRSEVFRSLVTRSPWGLWVPVFDVVYPNDLGVPERPVVDSSYFTFVKRVSRESAVFVPALYLGLSAIMLVPTLWWGMRAQNQSLLMAAALYGSGMSHMIGLFVFAASADFRYSHWLVTSTVLASTFVACEMLKAAASRLRRCHDGCTVAAGMPAAPGDR